MELKKGLILEGGGLRGNYTAGVLDAFLEEGVEFPYIIGVSAGAGMGCSYVSKQRGRNLEILKKYRRDPRYLSFRSFIRTGNLFGLDFIYHDIPHRLVPFDFEAFNRSSSRFVTVCTGCESGEAVYFENGEDLLTVLKASSALPYISKMVSYGAGKFLDGAIVDAIPLQKAIEAGYQKNVVIMTQPAGYRKKEEPHPPARLFYGNYPRLIRALDRRVAVYNRAAEFAEAEARAGRALIIRPSRDLGVTRTEKNVEKLIRLYELGLADGREALAKIEA
ncbi:MAG: patatin family protein [Treponema sp.]|jgi:predicted patatin/cPLA2 family phospholipase|nr:patatin family protein [Treponema sp.]